MRYILFVASPSQVNLVAESLEKIGAKKPTENDYTEASFVLSHRKIGDLQLHIQLLDSIEAVTSHLRVSPVDMLIYDERGTDGTKADIALERLQTHLKGLAKLWGPDFLFPLKRAVAILEDSPDAAKRAFKLGRDHVRDVQVAPKHLGLIFRWLAKLVLHDEKEKPHIGMGLTGGGIEGLLYQLGAFYALESSFKDSRDIYNCDLYSGISSGSIVASLAANHIPMREVIRSMYGKSKILKPLKIQEVFQPAVANIGTRFFRETFKKRNLDVNELVSSVMRSIPTGFFKGDAIGEYLERAFAVYGQHDAFIESSSPLIIGATDQDTYEHVTFSRENASETKISLGVRASCALPPFFTPVPIGDRHFVDGQITRTINLSELVKGGCRMIVIFDPLQPFSSSIAGSMDKEGGLFALIQTVKALVYSRFQNSLLHLTERYPEVDFVVFQPSKRCSRFMAGSPMRFRLRKKVIELAYEDTIDQIYERHEVYRAKFGKFGKELKDSEKLLQLKKKGFST